jgi:hypothetical protein
MIVRVVDTTAGRHVWATRPDPTDRLAAIQIRGSSIAVRLLKVTTIATASEMSAAIAHARRSLGGRHWPDSQVQGRREACAHWPRSNISRSLACGCYADDLLIAHMGSLTPVTLRGRSSTNQQ